MTSRSLCNCLLRAYPDGAGSQSANGGYAGGNTAEGSSALLNVTGAYNTGVGVYSLLSLTDGNFNTAIGALTLLLNTANENTATGAGALLSNTVGTGNLADGASLFLITAKTLPIQPLVTEPFLAIPRESTTPL